MTPNQIRDFYRVLDRMHEIARFRVEVQRIEDVDDDHIWFHLRVNIPEINDTLLLDLGLNKKLFDDIVSLGDFSLRMIYREVDQAIKARSQ